MRLKINELVSVYWLYWRNLLLDAFGIVPKALEVVFLFKCRGESKIAYVSSGKFHSRLRERRFIIHSVEALAGSKGF